MRTHGSVFLMISAVLLSGTAVSAAGPMMPQESKAEYSADSIMETEQVAMKAKVYHAPGKERREMEMGGMKQIQITRQDKKVVWTVMPMQKMYMEMSLDPKAGGPPQQGDLSNSKMEVNEVGDEVLDGLKTKKSKLVMTDPKGNKFGGFIWTTAEGIMVKMDSVAVAEGSKMRFKQELKNLKIEKQDPSLFEIPEGYAKMGMPGFGGGMQEMMKQQMK